MIKYDETNASEKLVYDYLMKRSEEDQPLKEKLESTEKTVGGALQYCSNEARKVANGKSSVAIEDKQVYEWCVHYLLEDKLNEELKVKQPKFDKNAKPTNSIDSEETEEQEEKKPTKKVAKKKEEPKPQPASNKNDFEQLSLF